MEMGVLQLARRFFGIETGLNPRLVRAGRLSTMVEREMRNQKVTMTEDMPPFYWLAGNFKKTTEALRAAIYETEPDIIFADASYLLDPESKSKRFGSRREVIAEVIGDMSRITKETNKPIVQSVQFNRTAVRSERGAAGEQASRDPLAHLTLEKIGETDVIGQNSAIVLAIEVGDPPHEGTRRYLGIKKGREGEHGWFMHNYLWEPVNFDYITDWQRVRDQGRNGPAPAAPNLDFMNAEV
jgi:replicative DNA helicase